MGESIKNEPATPSKKIEGIVGTRKKPFGQKFAEVFFSESAKDVYKSAVFDIVVPAIKETIYDLLTNSLQMTLWGSRTGRPESRGYSETSYSDYWRKSNTRSVSYRSSIDDRRPTKSYTDMNSRFDLDNLIFKDLASAQDFKSEMVNVCKHDGKLTVLYLKSSLRDMDTSSVEQDYGWFDLREDDIRITITNYYDDDRNRRKGYMVIMPRVEYLK